MYYPYDDSFNFSVVETPDITVPVNMSAYGDESGISVSWAPVPPGCATDDDGSRSASAVERSPLKFKPGPNTRQHMDNT